MTGAAFLWLSLAGVAAVLNWVAVAREARPLEYVAKPLTMVLLILAALAMDVDDPAVRTWFVIALLLCLAGDVFLMLPSDRFVLGLGSFLLGHLAFVGGLLARGVTVGRLAVGVVLVGLAMAAVGSRVLRAVREGPEAPFATPVTVYMVVISAMVASAIGTGNAAAILGASSFYASDATLAWNRFVSPLRHGRVLVMVTYHLGQLGLVLSLL